MNFLLQIHFDFERLYPAESMMLITNYSEYKRKILPFLIAALKTSTIPNKDDQMEKLTRVDQMDCETSDFLVMYYLPVYLKPSKLVKLVDRNCKPTIVESQNYFIRLIPVSFTV